MYHAVDACMIRASVFAPSATLPAWPDLSGDTEADVRRWREWTARVWADESVAAAIEVASPSLADAVRQVLAGERRRPRAVRRTVVSLARYLLRMRHRATPFGLFAGAAPVRIGRTARVRWGTGHRAFARADAVWLHGVVTALERDPDVLRRLHVVADPACTVRGGHVTVQHQPGIDGPTDTTLRRTPAVEAVLALARTPLTVGDLAAKLSGDYPDTPPGVIEDMLRSLVAHRVLLTGLHAPMTCTDALGHLVTQLETAGAAPDTARDLRQIHTLLVRHDSGPPEEQRALRARAATRMRALSGAADHGLAVDLRPECDIVLPQTVIREAERALAVMARITPYPHGSPAWKDYRARFLERYSLGAIVPLRDLADPDTGLGFPAGYRGTVLPRPVLAAGRRDEHLLALAQEAALDDRREVVLGEEDIEALSLGTPDQVPAHVELCFTVLSPSLQALERGRFTLSHGRTVPVGGHDHRPLPAPAPAAGPGPDDRRVRRPADAHRRRDPRPGLQSAAAADDVQRRPRPGRPPHRGVRRRAPPRRRPRPGRPRRRRRRPPPPPGLAVHRPTGGAVGDERGRTQQRHPPVGALRVRTAPQPHRGHAALHLGRGGPAAVPARDPCRAHRPVRRLLAPARP